MADWTFEPFERTRHDRSQFRCGQSMLDRFLHELVTQYEKRKLGRTFVMVKAGSAQVVGYYTLAASAISFEIIPQALAKQLPKHPIPAILLGRLAVDQSMQGRGAGADMLVNALSRSLELSMSAGIHFVEVVAINEQAVNFYQKFGFVTLLDEPSHMVIPLKSIEKIV